MRLEQEFAAIRAEETRQGQRDLAASIAKEHKLPESDADLLLTYSEDPRMMRVLAKRLEQDRPLTAEEQIRSSVRQYRPHVN